MNTMISYFFEMITLAATKLAGKECRLVWCMASLLILMLLVRQITSFFVSRSDLVVSKFTNHRSLVTFWSTSKTRSPPFPTQCNDGILAKARNALKVITRPEIAWICYRLLAVLSLLRLLQIKLDPDVLPFVQNCETICESSASRANSQPSVESWTRTDTSAAESACRNYSILRSMQPLLKFTCRHQELCCHPSASWGPIFSG